MTFRMMAAILVAFTAQQAAAQSSSAARATLAGAIDGRGDFVVNGTVWVCDGSVCSGPAGNGRFGDVATCRDLAKKVGAVAAYRRPSGDLSPDDLASCNQRAKGNR